MAAEPINIFSHKRDVAGIAVLIRQMSPGAKITGADDAWEQIRIEGEKSWLRKTPILVLKNVPDYYSGADWPKQIAGMQGYFSRFPDVPRKPDIFRVIRSFRFALATEFEPELYLQSNDSRLRIIFAVTRHLDGVLFTPSGLWDAAGRPLLCADGRSEAEAVLPSVPEESSQPATRANSTADSRRSRQGVPPEPIRVAKRALCLAAVGGRGLLEIENMPHESAEKERKRLLTWVGELALENELEPEEIKVLQQSVGTLPQQTTANATWRLEGLGVLAWALRKFDLPAYDDLVDAGVLLPSVGFLNLNQATALLTSPHLRPHAELSKLQEQCFALHWRLRQFRLEKKPMDFRTFAQKSWFGPLDVSSARFCDDDLAIGNAAINDAAEAEFLKTSSVAQERHQAINWLADGGDIYSETDTST